MRRVILYVDERREEGQKALELLKGLPYVQIPTSGGLPRAIYGRARFDGLEQLALLAELLRAEAA